MQSSDVKKFMELAEERPDVAEKIEAIGYDDLDALAAYATSLGLAVTADDLARERDSTLSSKRELDDAELDAVVGGFLFRRRRQPAPPPPPEEPPPPPPPPDDIEDEVV